MAKDKERTINPAQAQRKLEKQKAVKKGKAELQARRNEKLARRNPERIQKQIDDLKATEASGQPLRPREKQILEGLERDLRAVKKARDVLGDKAPPIGSGRTTGPPRHYDRAILGKRRREGPPSWQESDSSDTDESVRGIPMPKDTPPPIPRPSQPRRNRNDHEGERQPHPLPQRPEAIEVKTFYESAPVLRNLRQEAVSKFVPAVVRRQQDAVRGQGHLVEPEEMDRLEKAGYVRHTAAGTPTPGTSLAQEDEEARLAEEEERFNRDLRSVQIEEATDEDS